MGFFLLSNPNGADMTEIRKRFHISADSIAVGTALTLAVVVRLGWIRHVPW
jgi:hypothetical protein